MSLLAARRVAAAAGAALYAGDRARCDVSTPPLMRPDGWTPLYLRSIEQLTAVGDDDSEYWCRVKGWEKGFLHYLESADKNSTNGLRVPMTPESVQVHGGRQRQLLPLERLHARDQTRRDDAPPALLQGCEKSGVRGR